MNDLNLDEIRKKIDSVDKDLTRLFEERMNLVIQVARYKEENDQKIFDSEREKKVIEKNKAYLSNHEYDKSLVDFYNSLMSISRRYQAKQIFSNNLDSDEYSELENLVENASTPKHNPKVVYQGVPGAYSEEAMINAFGHDVKSLNVKEFEDVFRSLKDDDIDYGVLPIENSSTGSITEVYDYLRKYGYYIVGETSVKVDQNLLVLPGTKLEDIKEVYSHQQGLSQSESYLKQFNWNQVAFRNTAESAKLVQERKDKSIAAIASRRAAELYNLEILAPSINYNSNNYTRFVIIGKRVEIDGSSNKISIIFSAPHKAGSLYGALSYFAENNLNMLRIESRPVVSKSWE
ncbi:MAG: chorismate mutase, partial [Andreesenia angusta]|nr:chorismate mutase [Andreesenia angusta]